MTEMEWRLPPSPTSGEAVAVKVGRILVLRSGDECGEMFLSDVSGWWGWSTGIWEVSMPDNDPEQDDLDATERKDARDRTKDWLDDPKAKKPPEDATTDEVPDEPGEPLEGEDE